MDKEEFAAILFVIILALFFFFNYQSYKNIKHIDKNISRLIKKDI